MKTNWTATLPPGNRTPGGPGSVTSDHNAIVAALTEIESSIPSGAADFGAVLSSSLFANVKDYGATGDGTTDDTVAIQNTINAVQAAGGGVVYLPRGVYHIQPQNPRVTDPGAAVGNAGTEGMALSITASNVTFRGAGRHLTKIVMYGYGNVDLSAVPNGWQTVNGKVWRGSAIFIQGAPSGSKVTGLVFEDFELSGTAGFTSYGQYSSPANVTTGDGWDVTNKGLYFGGGQHFGSVRILRCYIHKFRGECVYHGTNGDDLDYMLLQFNELSDTNGDGHSVGGGITSMDNYIHDSSGNGIEDTNNKTTYPCRYERNRIENCGLQGISMGAATTTGPWGAIVIADNYIYNCRGGIQLYGIRKTWVHDNLLIDAGQTTLYTGSTGTNGITLQTLTNKPVADIVIERNTFLAVSAACQHAIGLQDSVSAGIVNVIIRDNLVMLTQEGIVNGASYLSGFVGQPSASEINILQYGNRAINTTYNYTDKLPLSYNANTTYGGPDTMAVDFLLTATTNTTLVTHRPDLLKNFFVYVYYRVITATTNVTITLTYYDGSGTVQTIAVVPLAATTVGAYSITPIFISAQGVTESQYVTLKAQAGTANQVYVSASIQEVM